MDDLVSPLAENGFVRRWRGGTPPASNDRPIKRKPRAGASGTFFCLSIVWDACVENAQSPKRFRGNRLTYKPVRTTSAQRSRRSCSARLPIFAGGSEMDVPQVVVDLSMNAAQRHLA